MSIHFTTKSVYDQSKAVEAHTEYQMSSNHSHDKSHVVFLHRCSHPIFWYGVYLYESDCTEYGRGWPFFINVVCGVFFSCLLHEQIPSITIFVLSIFWCALCKPHIPNAVDIIFGFPATWANVAIKTDHIKIQIGSTNSVLSNEKTKPTSKLRWFYW